MKISQEDLNQLVEFRKELHQYPEISQQEKNTSERILEFLGKLKNGKVYKNVGQYGIIMEFDSGQPGKTTLIRGDIDALPIQEINTFPHTSKIKGVAHMCGHDGHTSVIAGLVKILDNHPIKNGKVLLLFQPAEENGEGAKAVLTHELFSKIKPDFVFAFHNLPGYELNEVVVKDGAFTASVKSIILKINGKTAHAAEPEHGINPALPIAELIQFFEGKNINDMAHPSFRVLTPVYSQLGDFSYGISAGYGELHYTIRSWTSEVMNSLVEEITEKVNEIEAKYKVKIETGWTQEFETNQNNSSCVDMIREAAIHSKLKLTEREFAFKWGEDFGLFTQKFPGAMFGIGAGKKSPALHNPDYDYPDEITPTAIQLFDHIITKNHA